MTVRAKFVVNSVTETLNWDRSKGSLFTVKLGVVNASSGNEENKAFFASSPSGEISLTYVNPAVGEYLKIGDSFYVDFTKAE